MPKVNVSQLVNKILAVLTPREREVVERRQGLKDGQPLTLAEIGDTYGITRERVRQIESAAFNKLSGAIKKGELDGFFGVVENHLKLVGGLRKEGLLLDDLKYLLREEINPKVFGNQVKFLLALSDSVSYVDEDKNFHSHWYSSKEARQRAVGFVSKLAKFLENKKEVLLSQPIGINAAVKEVAGNLSLKDGIALNFVSVSKLFHVNQFGDFGLADWPEVNPRTVRHWSYLVLRKDKIPMHFTRIAERINLSKKGAGKKVNAQTVHNELIKDARFVLVGRGTYGLQEFGLVPGTARQVIVRLIKSHGPLKPRDVVSLVKKERTFKDNTIFINLQNKKHFNRLSDGRYAIRES